MRVIKPSRIHEFQGNYPRAASSLSRWLELVEANTWANVRELRATFPSADPVVVKSRRTVMVFNIAGNHFRLITAIHYNTGIVYVMMFLTHAEYGRNAWKETL